MNWYLKAFSQKLLSIIPYSEDINFFFQTRVGGLKQDIDVTGGINQMRKTFEFILRHYSDMSELKVTEIGTGIVPIVPMALALAGAECHTFDVKRLLRPRIAEKIFSGMADSLPLLSEMSASPLSAIRSRYEAASRMTTMAEILECLNIHYHAPVDTRRLPLPDNCHDLIVSRAVLQHIHPNILPGVIDELYRVSKKGGIAIHIVSLHDEYADVDPHISTINFLKYRAWLWETFGNNSLKYINRARYPYYIDVFQRSGFAILEFLKRTDERAVTQLPAMNISREFSHHSEEELTTIGFTTLLMKR